MLLYLLSFILVAPRRPQHIDGVGRLAAPLRLRGHGFGRGAAHGLGLEEFLLRHEVDHLLVEVTFCFER